MPQAKQPSLLIQKGHERREDNEVENVTFLVFTLKYDVSDHLCNNNP